MRRRKPPEPISTIPDRDYWLKYLKHEGLITDIPMETRAAPAASPPPKEPPGLSEDMTTFINRVGYQLMPGSPDLREKYRDGLKDCLLGNRNFNEWFNSTGADLGIHSYNLLKTLYDALEGLQSPQCKRLRQEYLMSMKKYATAL